MNRNLLFGIFISILVHTGLVLVPNPKIKPKTHSQTVVSYISSTDNSSQINDSFNFSNNSKTLKSNKSLNFAKKIDISNHVNALTIDKQTRIQNQTQKQLLTKTQESTQNTVFKPQNDQNSLKKPSKSDQITSQNNLNPDLSESNGLSNSTNQSSNSSNSLTGSNNSEISQTSNQLNSSGINTNSANTNEKPANETDLKKEKTITDTIKPDENLIKKEQAATRAFTSAVNRACNAAKYFPEALQNQNISGKVSLILSFSSSGLSSVSISSSSGNNDLDQAALNAVKRANLPSIPTELSRKLPIRVRIALTFKLNQ